VTKKQSVKSTKKPKKLKLSKKTLKDLSSGTKEIQGGMPPQSKFTYCGNTPDCYKPNPY
jgi:hypothetical protein